MFHNLGTQVAILRGLLLGYIWVYEQAIDIDIVECRASLLAVAQVFLQLEQSLHKRVGKSVAQRITHCDIYGRAYSLHPIFHLDPLFEVGRKGV